MSKDQNITLIKSLLQKHSELTKLWHEATYEDQGEAEELADELFALERDITFIAGDIFGEDN